MDANFGSPPPYEKIDRRPQNLSELNSGPQPEPARLDTTTTATITPVEEPTWKSVFGCDNGTAGWTRVRTNGTINHLDMAFGLKGTGPEVYLTCTITGLEAVKLQTRKKPLHKEDKSHRMVRLATWNLVRHRKKHECDCDFAYLGQRFPITYRSVADDSPVLLTPTRPCKQGRFMAFNNVVNGTMRCHDQYCGCGVFGSYNFHQFGHGIPYQHQPGKPYSFCQRRLKATRLLYDNHVDPGSRLEAP